MMLMMDLDPDLQTQALYLVQFDRDSIHDIAAELRVDGLVVTVGALQQQDDACKARLNNLLWAPTGSPEPRYCLVFDHQAVHGSTYELVVEARDRPTARAETTVPGDFEITAAEAIGDPPGTERLAATWSASERVHRYVLFVRDLSNHPLSPAPNLPFAAHGWALATRDTTVDTVVPADEIPLTKSESEWVVSVYSVDQALYDYFSSGTQDELFPVPPASNIVDGFGVFGSWVRRLVPVDSLPL